VPRFVILTHDHPFPHWDLMLEDGAELLTWRLLDPLHAGQSAAAELLAPHRLHYLDHEGPVSGGRGTVSRWDRGTFAWLRREADHREVVLAGERCRGRMELRRGETGCWTATLHG
jgi:hypothetical protein